MSGSTAPDNGELKFIAIDQRAYRYIRQFSIKSLYDACVELLTNCDDAYNRAGMVEHKAFYISYEASDGTISFTDNATGISGGAMSGCFLQAGAYSSTAETRGFFSRGAKDVSILGNVTFESIKDGLYSRCLLTSDAYGRMEVLDAEVTSDQRIALGIPENGTRVSIRLLEQFRIANYSEFCRNLSRLAVLRDIMSSNTNIVLFTASDSSGKFPAYIDSLMYEYPMGDLLLDMEFTVPGYPAATGRFVVNRSRKPIEQPLNDNQMEFAFLVKSNSSIHEVSTLQSRFRWHPYMNHLYGTLRCDYINELMYDIEKNGASIKNPMIIIDPSRGTGLNAQHPFTKALMNIPIKRLDLILQEMDSVISRSMVTIAEFSDIVKQLQLLGTDLFKEQQSSIQWKPNYKEQLIKTIQDDRQNFVSMERNFMPNLYEDDTDLNSARRRIRAERARVGPSDRGVVYIIKQNGEVLDIPVSNITALTGGATTPEALKGIYETIFSRIPQDEFVKNPYIYRLDEHGELAKMYVYQPGNVEDATGGERPVSKDVSKALKITFTGDINMRYRYDINYSGNATTIRININDPIIRQHLMPDTSSSTKEEEGKGEISLTSDVSQIAQHKGFIFLSELFIEIFARIMLHGDIQSNKISLVDSEDVIGCAHKLFYNYEKMVNTVQQPITELFKGHYNTGVRKNIEHIVAMAGDMAAPEDIADRLFNAMRFPASSASGSK
jgi:hypothetical protein